MKKFLLVIACLAAMLLVLPAEATLTLPNYAQGGNVTQDVQTKGKAITDFVSMIVAILAIIGMLVGAGYYAVGTGEKGKMFVIGGLVALIISGSVYGIAALAL